MDARLFELQRLVRTHQEAQRALRGVVIQRR